MVGGTELDGKHLRILNVWGVSEVEIAGSEGEQDGPPKDARTDPEVLAACDRFVRNIFGRDDTGGEFAAELFRLTVGWFAAKLTAGESLPPLLTGLPPGPSPEKPPPSLEKMLVKSGKMIACPDVYLRINEALKNPNCSVAHLADIVGKDIGLSAKLLQLVNSPIYGYSMKVDSLLRGITILGFKELSQLVLGLSVFNQFLGIRADLLNVREFLKHGLSCGILARILASHRPDLPEERFFIAGLLHDIGRMTMLTVSPAHLAAAMAKSAAEGRPWKNNSSGSPTPRSAAPCCGNGSCLRNSRTPSATTMTRRGPTTRSEPPCCASPIAWPRPCTSVFPAAPIWLRPTPPGSAWACRSAFWNRS